MGGCLLTDKFGWGARMFAIATTPPDPALVGDAMARDVDGAPRRHGLWLRDWLRHQRRDEF